MGVGSDSPVTGLPPALISMQAAEEKGLNLNLDFGRSLRMRRGVGIAVGTFTLLALIPFGLTRKPFFQATSLIYIQPVVSKAATDTSGSYDSYRYDAYVAQQLVTLHRPDLLGEALDRLPPPIRATLSSDKVRAIKEMEGSLKAERIPSSYQISVSVEGVDPVTVAPIANAITAVYLENGQQDDLALSHRQLESLVQDRKLIEDELEKNRQEQADLSNVLGMADTSSDGGNPFDVNLADLRTQLAAARSAHAVAEAQLASVNGKQSQLDSAADSVVRSDAELSALRANLGARRGTLVAEMSGLTPGNPLYKRDQAELNELSETLNDLTKEVTHKSGQTLKNQLALEAARTGDVQARLEGELARQTAAATASTPKLQRARDLAESIRLLQARYADVDNAIHSLMLGQNPSFAAHTSLIATPPTAPLPSKKIAILVLAFPIAVLFGVATALIMQKLDSRIYIGEDVDHVLKISSDGSTPRLRRSRPRSL